MSMRNSEHYEDSHDMIERIRKLRDAAEKKMNAFGDPAGYDVRIVRGRKSELQAAAKEDAANEN
jgi:hypothetical protein